MPPPVKDEVPEVVVNPASGDDEEKEDTKLSFKEKQRRFSNDDGPSVPAKKAPAKLDLTLVVLAKKESLDEAEMDVRYEIEQGVPDVDDLRFAWEHYTKCYRVYQEFVAKFQEQQAKEKNAPAIKSVEKELVRFSKYYVKLEYNVSKHLTPTSQRTSPTISATVDSGLNKLKYPKRALPQFTGEVREYLSFWSRFKEIDGDSSLKDIDKFHLLVESTKDESAARKLLNSFPFSSENYQPALQSLKERFGRENVLVKVYIRDLLQLVIEASTGKDADFGDLVTTITSQIRNLESLGVTQDKCAQVLYPVVEACLPSDVLQAWQRSSSFKEELNQLMSFLQAEVNNYTERKLAHFKLGGEGNHKKGSGGNKSKNYTDSSKGGDVLTTSSFHNSNNRGSNRRGNGGSQSSGGKQCVFCEMTNHYASDCRKEFGMSLSSKREALSKSSCCYVCLRKGHQAKLCKLNPKCSMCSGKHLEVMCNNLDHRGGRERNSSSQNSAGVGDEGKIKNQAQPPCDNNKSADTTTFSKYFQVPETPLQTLVVKVHGTNGKAVNVRAVIDSGSQKSYVLTKLAEDLKLAAVGEEEVVHQLFGGVKSSVQKHKIVKVFVSDLKGKNNCNFNVSSTQQIAVDIIPPPPGPWIEQLRKEGIQFTDINSSKATPIGLMIGNDIAPRLFTGRKRDLQYGPVAMETLWGWVLCGKCPIKRNSSTSTMMVTNLLHIEGMPLSALWDLEAIGIADPAVKESRKELEEATQKHFDQTTKQLTDGRYEVRLPFIYGKKQYLSSNYYAASRRLRNLTKDLQQRGYFEKYSELFQQWERDGMIEEVTGGPASHYPLPDDYECKVHDLPHRAVVKLSSSTTPIRPVFDVSAKAKGKLSLNECMVKGPNTLEQIPPILIGFRLRKIGALADVKKAFQQISVAPEDRDYLRFLWWEDWEKKIEKVYRHCRVVFGVTCSPYLLGATLRHHLTKAKGRDVEVAKKLLKCTYVDNTIVSLNSMEEAKEFQKTATSLLIPAQFELRCWECGPSSEEKVVPVLGLIWSMREDTLQLDATSVVKNIDKTPTLRQVLSLVHSIYDPLGFASPFTILGKLLLRRSHEEKATLDNPLPDDLKTDVLKWAEQIPLLADMKIPRHVHFGEENKSYSIHIMCDASSLATAAAVYLRVEGETEIKVFLIAAKSRVAPKGKATIPRLELVACVLAARLLHNTLEDIRDPELPITLWSDSSTALAWIRGAGPWGVFVSNCVKKVRDSTSVASWRHVPGKENIADLPSRGCSARKLLESKWWEGPEWLRLPSSQWPNSEEFPDSSIVDGERKKTVTVAMATANEEENIMEKFLRFSSYPKSLKILAYWMKYKEILKLRVRRENPHHALFEINTADIQRAEEVLIHYLQQVFRDEPERIKKLNPLKDDCGLIRVRTRLTLPDDAKFSCPILLPEKNEVVSRMMRWEHEKNIHAGVSTVLGIIRESFWVVNGRRTVRGVLTKCWICKRFTARRTVVPEGPLPSSRSELGVPFHVTGVDAAGPLILKKTGGGPGEKVWILLFTCASYRAVHLELVDTLTADGFVRALRRFVSRRGRPKILYSDNLRGFEAAHRSLVN